MRLTRVKAARPGVCHAGTMSTRPSPAPEIAVSLWSDVVRPKEHGSWSLAFEPLALGLLVAPSRPGTLLAGALAAAFFARRPLRLAWSEPIPERRRRARLALGICGGTALAALGGAIALVGLAWLVWLVPAAAAAAVFAWFDTRGAGREEAAELAGAAAFALTPSALAVLGGLSAGPAAALGLMMTARSVPSVALVRAFLRAAKTGVRRDGPAVALALVALAGLLALRGWAPAAAPAAAAALALRTIVVLIWLRPAWRARTLGMVETVLGLAYAGALAAAWPA